MKPCPQCKEPNPDKLNFCGYCGANLNNGEIDELAKLHNELANVNKLLQLYEQQKESLEKEKENLEKANEDLLLSYETLKKESEKTKATISDETLNKKIAGQNQQIKTLTQQLSTAQNRKSNKGWFVFLILLCIGLGISAIIFYGKMNQYQDDYLSKHNENTSLQKQINQLRSEQNEDIEKSKKEDVSFQKENDELQMQEKKQFTAFPDETKIKDFIQKYCQYTIDNNFQGLKELYAPTVKRYHDAYNKDREYVIDCYKRYDKKFGVYGKHSNIRWNTLQINPKGRDLVYVQYVEDYSIDRNDKNKYSQFVLEKHVELNEYYQIVSVYDVQLSKSK